MKKSILSVLVAVCCLIAADCGTANTSDKETEAAVTSSSSMSAGTTAATVKAEASAHSETTSSAPAETTAAVTDALKSDSAVPGLYNKGTAEEITLSGNPEDRFIAEEDCYVLTENTVLYIRKGAEVRGDLAQCAERKLADVCEVTGLDHHLKTRQLEELQFTLDGYFDSGSYVGMNSDDARVNILLATLEGDEIQWAGGNFTVLDDADLYSDCDDLSVAHHELTHVVFLNNGVDLGSTLNEGIATYYSEILMEKYGNHTWNWVQYYYPFDFDNSSITDGGEGFDYSFHGSSNRSVPYIYGFTFCKFLTETYGDDILTKVLSAATKAKFDAGFDPNNEQESLAEDTECMKNIIISVTGDDVFGRFAEWYTVNWESERNEWKEYMTSKGEDVSFL